jgi:hypothetical protein
MTEARIFPIRNILRDVGRDADTDILIGAGRASADVLNKLLGKRKKPLRGCRQPDITAPRSCKPGERYARG